MKIIGKRYGILVALLLFSFMGMSAYAVQDNTLFDTLKKPAYRASWNAMFKGEKGVPLWIRNITKGVGQAAPCKASKIDANEYEAHDVCKPHDCGDNNFIVLFASDGKQAWGVLVTTKFGKKGERLGDSERFFGNPDQKMKDALINAKKCEPLNP